MWRVVKYHLPGIVITVTNCFLIVTWYDERIVHRKFTPKIYDGINHPVTN